MKQLFVAQNRLFVAARTIQRAFKKWLHGDARRERYMSAARIQAVMRTKIQQVGLWVRRMCVCVQARVCTRHGYGMVLNRHYQAWLWATKCAVVFMPFFVPPFRKIP